VSMKPEALTAPLALSGHAIGAPATVYGPRTVFEVAVPEQCSAVCAASVAEQCRT
jgi:hypothetical protein